MKVLITGGGGFIGSHLADRLLADGHEALVVDNFETGRRDNLRPRDGLELVEGSIADSELVEQLFIRFQPSHVVHAAASYKDPSAWQADLMTNAVGTANIVDSTLAAGLDRLIYFQTALCYGTNPREQPVTLSHPSEPDSSYAISKTAGELYIQMAIPRYVSFRLANAYGPRNISGPLPTFYDRLTTGKPCFVMDTRRDFIFIDDLIEIVLKALGGAGEGAYHVSSGSDYSIKALFDATVAALGIELDEDVEVRPKGADDAYTILLDPTRAQQDFGWNVTTPLEEGVAQAVSYYRKYGIEQTYTHLEVAGDR